LFRESRSTLHKDWAHESPVTNKTIIFRQCAARAGDQLAAKSTRRI
jgi:hypothetical protein